MSDDETTCGRFCDNPAAPPHPCPYNEEIHGSDKLCTCCAKCTQECAWDI